ncbi:hypothetical protein EZS27_023592, partial [termite gut metagenome]
VRMQVATYSLPWKQNSTGENLKNAGEKENTNKEK